MSKKDASPPKKKSSASPAAATSAATTTAAAKVVITPEIEEEVKALLKAGTWREMKQESTGKVYYYNKATKATCWDLKKEIAKQKAAGGGASAPAAAAASPSPLAGGAAFNIPSATPSASEGEAVKSDKDAAKGSDKESASPAKKIVAKKTTAKASSKASAKSSDSGDADLKEQEEQERENDIREQAAKETAAAVASAVAEVQAAAARERQQLENKELQIKEQEMNLEKQRNTKLRDLLKYTDPLDRLVQENSLLQQLVVSGSSGHVALDFQAKYEATMRTNNALTVQMARMKQEYDAMQRALTDANFKIHQQQAQLLERQGPSSKGRDDELHLTMSHLREQNRELIQQVCELSLLLSRGLHEISYRAAMGRDPSAEGFGDPASAEYLSNLITRALDSNPIRNLLCSNCMSALARLRDQSVPPTQSAIQAFGLGESGGASIGVNSSAQYIGINSLDPQQALLGGAGGGSAVGGYVSGGGVGSGAAAPSIMTLSAMTPRQQQGGNHSAVVSQNMTSTGVSMVGMSPIQTSSIQSTSALGGGAKTPGGLFGGVTSSTAAQLQPQQHSSVQRGVGGIGGNSSSVVTTPIMYGGFMVRNPKAGN